MTQNKFYPIDTQLKRVLAGSKEVFRVIVPKLYAKKNKKNVVIIVLNVIIFVLSYIDKQRKGHCHAWSNNHRKLE